MGNTIETILQVLNNKALGGTITDNSDSIILADNNNYIQDFKGKQYGLPTVRYDKGGPLVQQANIFRKGGTKRNIIPGNLPYYFSYDPEKNEYISDYYSDEEDAPDIKWYRSKQAEELKKTHRQVIDPDGGKIKYVPIDVYKAGSWKARGLPNPLYDDLQGGGFYLNPFENEIITGDGKIAVKAEGEFDEFGNQLYETDDGELYTDGSDDFSLGGRIFDNGSTLPPVVDWSREIHSPTFPQDEFQSVLPVDTQGGGITLPEVTAVPNIVDRSTSYKMQETIPNDTLRNRFYDYTTNQGSDNISQRDMAGRFMELYEKSGSPKIEMMPKENGHWISEMPEGTPHEGQPRALYTQDDINGAAMYVGPITYSKEESPIMSELAHAYQYNNPLAKDLGLEQDWEKILEAQENGTYKYQNDDIPDEYGNTAYNRLGNNEYNAHAFIQPVQEEYMLGYLNNFEAPLSYSVNEGVKEYRELYPEQEDEYSSFKDRIMPYQTSGINFMTGERAVPTPGIPEKALGGHLFSLGGDDDSYRVGRYAYNIHDVPGTTLPEVTVNGYAPIILDTYFPVASQEYPITGHSMLAVPHNNLYSSKRTDSQISKLPQQVQESLNHFTGYDFIDKSSASPTYNLITNNCADATLGALNAIFGTNESPFLFTTPGDVMDYSKKMAEKFGGRSYTPKYGMVRTIIPRNKDNYKSTARNFYKYAQNHETDRFEQGGYRGYYEENPSVQEYNWDKLIHGYY